MVDIYIYLLRLTVAYSEVVVFCLILWFWFVDMIKIGYGSNKFDVRDMYNISMHIS